MENQDQFDELPEELQSKIFSKLKTRRVIRLAFISKSWFRVITRNHFPKTTSRSLPYVGLLFRLDVLSKNSNGRIAFCYTESVRLCGFGLTSIPYMGSRALPFRITAKALVDCRNGLILFCHRESAVGNPNPERPYNYYVLNPYTKQCAAVQKPGNTPANMYACLAYDPCVSCFFRIVRFLGSMSLNVYDSETRSWKNFDIDLEEAIANAQWLDQTVFVQGAVYRLSMSGHLLRFVIDKEVNPTEQAQAIDLPAGEPGKKYSKRGCIGVHNGQVNFMAFDEDLCLCIWVLTSTNEWSPRKKLEKIAEKFLMYDSKSKTSPDTDKFFRPLGFHPHLDVIYVGSNYRNNSWSKILWINFEDLPGFKDYGYKSLPYKDHNRINWHTIAPFSFFQSNVPFASGFGSG